MGGAASTHSQSTTPTTTKVIPIKNAIIPPSDTDIMESTVRETTKHTVASKRFSTGWHSPGNTISVRFNENPEHGTKKSFNAEEGVGVLLEGIEQLERLGGDDDNNQFDVEYFSNAGEMMILLKMNKREPVRYV